MLPNVQVACFKGKLSLTNWSGFHLEWPKNQHFHYLSLPWPSAAKCFLWSSKDLQHQVEYGLAYFFCSRLDLHDWSKKEIREGMVNYKNTCGVRLWNLLNRFLIIADLWAIDMGQICHKYFPLPSKCAWLSFSILAQSTWAVRLR